MTTSTPRNLPATEGPAMGPASPHSAAANELREEANDGRLIAAAAVCLPAPDRFGTWENEVPSLVCNASAPASGRWKLFWDRYLWVANRRQRGREPLVRSGAHATMFDGDGFAAKSAVFRAHIVPMLTSPGRPTWRRSSSISPKARASTSKARSSAARTPSCSCESRARGTDAAVGSGGRRRRPGGGRPG